MMISYFPAIIILLPWATTVWISGGWFWGINVGESGETYTARLTKITSFITLILLFILDIVALGRGVPGQVVLFPWIEIDSYRVMISFTVDRLSLIVGTLIAILGLLTAQFSRAYLHRENGFQRFFAVLNLLCGAMFLIAFAGNPLLMFIGWEIAGLASFLLIAYAYDRPTVADNATRVLIIKRFGDAAFLAAIILSLLWFKSLEWPELLFQNSDVESFAMGMVMMGFLVAALVKSAQLPFASWLSRALEGPTPSSAIFYGALLIHAGVFLVLRIEPMLHHSPGLRTFLIGIGLITAIYSALCGLVQNDVKSSIIFSTQSQVGLIFAECGAGMNELAIWHLTAHAIWRYYQLLSAPGYMQSLAGVTHHPIPHLVARHTWLYSVALHRFWLDELGDYLIVRPTLAIARDAHNFDLQAGTQFIKLFNIIGEYLQWIDRFLAQPHYLLLLIVVTFIVII